MLTELYEVEKIGEGKLFIMPKPSSLNIETDMDFYKSNGIDKIISLLEYDEADGIGLSFEKEVCENYAIDFVQYPIEDGGIPEKKSFMELLIKTSDELKKGLNIAVHCFGGIGRSGIFTCGTLMLNGYGVDEAVEFVSEKREYPVPETGAQYNFLKKIKHEYLIV